MTKPFTYTPERIVFIRPCCIGDVVLATACLKAIRTRFPAAHITWAVGGWSRQAVEHHPLVDAVLDTGSAALPVKSVGGFFNFVRRLWQGNFDLAISLVRSPLMSAAVYLSGIPQRAGLDSNGRGFGYNWRARIDPQQPRHEAEIYLDAARLLGAETAGCFANVPLDPDAQSRMRQQVSSPYIVINPAGGSNPGMVMDSKRYPPAQLAALANILSAEQGANIVLLAGPQDGDIAAAVTAHLSHPPQSFIGALSFPEMAALAAGALLYIGNDTGLTHFAAAAGARTVMILGPSDPARYAPFTPESLALWQPVDLTAGGVSAARHDTWDWARDGIPVEAALAQIRAFLNHISQE